MKHTIIGFVSGAFMGLGIVSLDMSKLVGISALVVAFVLFLFSALWEDGVL